MSNGERRPDVRLVRRPEYPVHRVALPTRLEAIMSNVQRGEDVGSENSLAPFEKRTFTDVEVAARLGVSRFTVRSWRLKGTGPRFLKMGRAVRYRPEDVDEYERRALVDTQAQSDRTPV